MTLSIKEVEGYLFKSNPLKLSYENMNQYFKPYHLLVYL